MPNSSACCMEYWGQFSGAGIRGPREKSREHALRLGVVSNRRVRHMAGSTIPLPPKKLRFSLTNVSGLLDIRKDAVDRKVSTMFSCVQRSIDR